MRVILCLLMVLSAAWPLRAEDRVFDLGFAHPGMEQARFRAHVWGDGGRVICSSDSDHPAELDLALPKGVARVGAVRCGVYAQDGAAHWQPVPLDVAGWPGEVRALFLPDAVGTQRLVQLKLTLPAPAFDDVARAWDQLFGLPTLRRDQLVHWTSAHGDAAIVGDGSERVHAYLLDNDLHTSANRRLGQMPARH